MGLDRQLLELLVCPITKQPMFLLKEAQLEKLNVLIEAGEIQSADGNVLSTPLHQALISRNGTVIYPVENDIPVMLEERSIPAHQMGVSG